MAEPMVVEREGITIEVLSYPELCAWGLRSPELGTVGSVLLAAFRLEQLTDEQRRAVAAAVRLVADEIDVDPHCDHCGEPLVSDELQRPADYKGDWVPEWTHQAGTNGWRYPHYACDTPDGTGPRTYATYHGSESV